MVISLFLRNPKFEVGKIQRIAVNDLKDLWSASSNRVGCLREPWRRFPETDVSKLPARLSNLGSSLK